MLVAPCSIKTLSAIANSYADNLIARAADVMLKERRPLLLLVRKTPLHRGHLRLMAQAAEAGAIIAPPVPAFYHRPTTLEDVIDQTIGRVLDQFGIETPIVKRWSGTRDAVAASRAGLVMKPSANHLAPPDARASLRFASQPRGRQR